MHLDSDYRAPGLFLPFKSDNLSGGSYSKAENADIFTSVLTRFRLPKLCRARKYGLQLIPEDQKLNHGTFTCPICPAEQVVVPAIKGLYKVADDWRLELDPGSLNTYISINPCIIACLCFLNYTT